MPCFSMHQLWCIHAFLAHNHTEDSSRHAWTEVLLPCKHTETKVQKKAQTSKQQSPTWNWQTCQSVHTVNWCHNNTAKWNWIWRAIGQQCHVTVISISNLIPPVNLTVVLELECGFIVSYLGFSWLKNHKVHSVIQYVISY